MASISARVEDTGAPVAVVSAQEEARARRAREDAQLQLLLSSSGVKASDEVDLANTRWLIVPTSRFMEVWDVVIIALLAFTAVRPRVLCATPPHLPPPQHAH